MSNPAVITLINASSRKGNFRRFVIEDNIGEAIHLHIDNMRVDFMVKEFLEFSSMVRDSLNNLNFLCGYNIENFQEEFLFYCADFLPNLIDIKIEPVKLSKLQCIVPVFRRDNKMVFKACSVKNSPAYKYFQGKEKNFKEKKESFSCFDKKTNLSEKLKLIKEKGYPTENKYIILFDRQEYIRSGNDYAAALAYLHGLEAEVKVMRFYFQGKKHLIKSFRQKLSMVFNKR